MGTLLRIGMTLLIILLTGVAIYFFRTNGIMALVSLVFGLILIAVVWFVSRMGNVQELQSQNSPQAIDRNTKKLIGVFNRKFNDQGIEEIGIKTQAIIVKTMKGLQAEEFKTEKHAVATLKRVPASKFEQATDTEYLAGTLAAYYVLADELNQHGFNTHTRVDNFIAGIHDESF
jgi:hypothetical protein